MSASGARRYAGRFAIIAVLSGLLLPFGSTLQGGSLDAAQAATGRAAHGQAANGMAAKDKPASSWKTARTEEFSGSSLPSGCGSYTGKYAAGQSAWSAKDAVVSSGLLNLKIEKRTTSGMPYTTGGVGCWGWAQKYGRYEVRAKVPAGKGIDSYLTLWPSKGVDTAWTGLELLAPGPETAYVTNGYGTKSEGARVTGEFSGAFHTYVIEWAPKSLRMTVDGKEIFYSARSYTGSRWFGMVVSNGDALTGVPDENTKLPASFQIDEVKVSSYTGVPPPAHADTTPRVAGVPTAVPSTLPPSTAEKLPAAAATTRVTALQPVSDDPALAGGVWPWLLGGSLIAGCAIASLNYPGRRKARQSSTHK
jgi:beta-glucanase (GH16 family)